VIQVKGRNTILEGLVVSHLDAGGHEPAAIQVEAPSKLRRVICGSKGHFSVNTTVGDCLFELCFVASCENRGCNTVPPVSIKQCFFAGSVPALKKPGHAVIADSVLTEGCRPVASPAEFLRCTIRGLVDVRSQGVHFRDCILDSVESTSNDVRFEHCAISGSVANAKPSLSCIRVEPQFVNPGNADYRLKPSCLCRKRASDGGDLGCRYNSDMIEILQVALELRRRGLISF